jgi:hypothetical protein
MRASFDFDEDDDLKKLVELIRLIINLKMTIVMMLLKKKFLKNVKIKKLNIL